jgi:DNA-binding NtrC family response regulator
LAQRTRGILQIEACGDVVPVVQNVLENDEVSGSGDVVVDTASSVAEVRDVLTLEDLERKHIKAALEASHGNRSDAARMLGISERNLYRKLNDYRLLP